MIETSASSSVEGPEAPVHRPTNKFSKLQQRITRTNRRTEATRSTTRIEQLIDGQINRASNTNVPSKTDVVVADLNFSREFYRENAQRDHDWSGLTRSLSYFMHGKLQY